MAVKYPSKRQPKRNGRSNTPTLARDDVIDLQEARRVKAKGPQNLSMAWDDDYLSIPGLSIKDGGTLNERDRKDTYYKAYIGNSWVRACVQAIAKRFTSGKWEVEELEKGKGVESNRERLKQLLFFINDDEDFKQFLRAIAEDLLIFGEAFAEIVLGADGFPAQLHKIDCVTMSTQFDKHGMVVGYTQSLDKSTETVHFEPDQVVRWWLPDPRASKKALSPIECMKDAVYLYQAMITWGEKFFKQGAKPGFSVEMGEDSNLDDANRYIKFFKENYMGIQNAHVPPVFYGGSKLVEFGKGSVELDFLKSLAWARDEILAGYNCPLNILGIQETAHLGGGSGESANKIFVYNTVKPIEELILEKFNYRIVQKACNILDWCVSVSHADYRDDHQIAQVQDIQIRNGSLTPDEARQERGREPYPKGGNTAFVVAGKEIIPVERLDEIADEQRQQTQLSLQGAQKALEQTENEEDGEDGNQQPPQAKGKQAKQAEEQLVRNAWAAIAEGAAKIGDTETFLEAVQELFGTESEEAARSRHKRLLEAKQALFGTKDYQTRQLSQHEARELYAEEAVVLHWQDTDKATQQTMAGLKESGVTHLTWEADKQACDGCMVNHGQTVKVGERFKSGAMITPEHNHCACKVIEVRGE